MGIRQKLAKEFGSSPDKEGNLGRQYAEDVTVTLERSSNYFDDLASSIFCGVFPGDGWSGRMEDSVLHGCIPVVIQVRIPSHALTNVFFFFFLLWNYNSVTNVSKMHKLGG